MDSDSIMRRFESCYPRHFFRIRYGLNSPSYKATWPSGKAKVCKTSTPRFESGCRLHTGPVTSYTVIGLFFYLFFFIFCPSPSFFFLLTYLFFSFSASMSCRDLDFVTSHTPQNTNTTASACVGFSTPIPISSEAATETIGCT